MDDQLRAELEISLAAAGTEPDLVAAAVATLPDKQRTGSSPRALDSGMLIGLAIAIAVVLWRLL